MVIIVLRINALIWLCILAGCSGTTPNAEHESLEEIKFVGKSNRSFTDFVDSISIIRLNTHDSVLIGDIYRYRITESEILIWNYLPTHNEVLIFSKEGTFQRKINKQGRGPDEYLSVADIARNPVTGNVLILDRSRKRISEYSDEDEIVNMIEFQNSLAAMEVLSCEDHCQIVVTTGENISREGENYSLFRLDETLTVIDRILPYESTIPHINWGTSYRTSRLNDTLIGFNKESDNIIYHIFPGGMDRKYKILFSKPLLPLSHANIEYISANWEDMNYIFNILYYESEEYLICDFVDNGMGFRGIYDKKANETYVIEAPKDPTCNCGGLMYPRTIIDNALSGIVDGYKAGEILKYLDPDYCKISPEVDITEIGNLPLESNPVIFMLYLSTPTL